MKSLQLLFLSTMMDKVIQDGYAELLLLWGEGRREEGGEGERGRGGERGREREREREREKEKETQGVGDRKDGVEGGRERGEREIERGKVIITM